MNLWKELSQIHYDLKKRFVYVKDLDRYGKVEYWARPNESTTLDGSINGDCEDFALAAQQACEEAGINNARLVICEVKKGAKHCVLSVEGYILDNRLEVVVGREELAYKWLKIQDYSGVWRAII